MPIWLSVILEIIKISLPALIVFFTVHTLLKQYLAGQERMKALELQQNRLGSTTPLRFQAYERLSLLCERIALPNLIMRMLPCPISSCACAPKPPTWPSTAWP